MLLSLLETILVTYLMDKVSQEKLQDHQEQDLDDCRRGQDGSIRFSSSVLSAVPTPLCGFRVEMELLLLRLETIRQRPEQSAGGRGGNAVSFAGRGSVVCV